MLEIIKGLGLISECHISKGIYEVMEAIEKCYYEEEVIEAYIYCLGSGSNEIQEILDKVNESYYGEFPNDIGFTEQLLEDTGDISTDLPSYVHIDWNRTSWDIMMDYTAHNKHYFRLM